jgi:hypothetical protein
MGQKEERYRDEAGTKYENVAFAGAPSRSYKDDIYW